MTCLAFGVGRTAACRIALSAPHAEKSAMTRAKALLLLTALWALLYLPGLGSLELKGEEGRRILPAVAMLETGNWLVPYLGGKPYLRKPPLVNWAIAASFHLTGVRHEFTARLPSALAALALGIGIVAVAGPGWMQVETALAAALMAMTSFGFLAKARFAGAEIEGIYVPLFGLAITLWLAGRARGWSPWAVWLGAAFFLGLGCLTKGPSFHLVFFYGIVGAVLWREKKLRELWHPAHGVGLVLGAAIFLAWLLPVRATPEGLELAAVWKRQGLDRFTDSEFNAGNYFTNLPRGLGDLLPWVLFAPLVYRCAKEHCIARHSASRSEDGARPERPSAARPLLVASAAMFVAVLLIPGTLPRYVLPLAVPLALGTALVVPSGFLQKWTRRYVGALGVLALIFAFAITPRMQQRDALRPLAAAVDAAVPAGTQLLAYDPGYQAAFFYLRTPLRYVVEMEEIPPRAAWVLAKARDRDKLARKRPDLAVVQEFRRRDTLELLLLRSRSP
jgi:4-amino-4-deoxy-L-arabinose transferase-like glycosyltransferase